MKTFCRALLVLPIFACLFFASATTWKTFKSLKSHFSIEYPSTWHLFDDAAENFEVFNFLHSKMVHGVALPKGGASVIVLAGPAGIRDISAWIPKDSPQSKILEKGENGPLSQEPGACTRLVEVEEDAEVGPHTYSHETSFYCATPNGLYRIWLSNWSDNPKQGELQQVALKMAISLRSWR
jgi:hypothetical protein